MHIGPMLSGEKLVDNKAFKKQLLLEFPKAIGGEMEGVGLYATAARRNCEWVVVNGIADWADRSKTEEWQPFAALAAATLVRAVLKNRFSLAELSPAFVVEGASPLIAALCFPEDVHTAPAGQGDNQPAAQAAKRARHILSAALKSVCDALNSDEAPFPSMREQVSRDLSTDDCSGSTLSIETLERLLKERLMDLMSRLRKWLQDQTELDRVERVREIIDVFAAAGMDSTWIREMAERLENAHIEIPTWTDIHLCEPVPTALFGKAATWVRKNHVDHDFIQVEAPGTDPNSRVASTRRDLAARAYGQVLQRSGGESDEAYEQRLPRRSRLAWTPHVHVLIDGAPAMDQSQPDVAVLLDRLQRLRGREGLHCRLLPLGPDDPGSAFNVETWEV